MYMIMPPPPGCRAAPRKALGFSSTTARPHSWHRIVLVIIRVDVAFSGIIVCEVADGVYCGRVYVGFCGIMGDMWVYVQVEVAFSA
jgi:hypothetical protein